MVKVTLDRAQSGGDQISVMGDNNEIWFSARIHLLPKKDGIVIVNTGITSDIGKE